MTHFRHLGRFAIGAVALTSIACTSSTAPAAATPSSNTVVPSEFAYPESFWDLSEASGITRDSAFEDAKFKLSDSLGRDLVAAMGVVASMGVIDGQGMDVFQTWPHCKAAIAVKLALSGIVASQSPEEAGHHVEVAILVLGYLTDLASDPAGITDGILMGAESLEKCHDFEDQRKIDD